MDQVQVVYMPAGNTKESAKVEVNEQLKNLMTQEGKTLEDDFVMNLNDEINELGQTGLYSVETINEIDKQM